MTSSYLPAAGVGAFTGRAVGLRARTGYRPPLLPPASPIAFPFSLPLTLT